MYGVYEFPHGASPSRVHFGFTNKKNAHFTVTFCLATINESLLTFLIMIADTNNGKWNVLLAD